MGNDNHFLQYLEFEMKSNIKVEKQNFIYSVINPASKLWEISESQAHFCFDKIPGKKFFFKRRQFPKVEGIQEEAAKTILQHTAQSFKNELQISQSQISRYILPYTSMIISYPYACLIHQPFLDNLSNFMKRALSFQAKIDLMIKIALGIDDLHARNVCVRALRPSTIVLIQGDEGNFEIAFSEVRSFEILSPKKAMRKMKVEESNIYTAPEIISGELSSLSCDIWSLGLIFYQLLLNRKPNMAKLQDQGILQFPDKSPKWIREFLEKMVQRVPKNRSKIKDILRFLKNAKLCSNELTKYHF